MSRSKCPAWNMGACGNRVKGVCGTDLHQRVLLSSFFHAKLVEELKNSSCSQMLEKYDSFSTKVSPEAPL